MSPMFIFILILSALGAFVFILKKIRKSEITIADSTFWFLFALSIVLLAIFPQIAFFFADILQIQSPANFVFLYVIAVLVIREFFSTVELSKLRARVTALAQREALRDLDSREDSMFQESSFR